MIVYLCWLTICSAVLYHWLAIYLKIKVAKFILKPGTMVLIIILAIYGSAFDSTFSRWVVLGLVLSLFGDVFLMMKEKWFVYGLASFLIAHLFYIVGFWRVFEMDITTLTSMLTGSVLFVFGICFFLFLSKPIKKNGGTKLSIAVAFYIAVISTMVWSACLVGIDILIFASLLFYISDAVLALNRFKKPFSNAENIVMSTYFTSQLLFAWSII
ncbi:lysoplasmalogenase [Virgibacillus ndiopensis]|uniref:lysoplasmalogenase n=1 Tax=Virgibacillus ndiopensis TaxID=2004408 RepID=UPI000C06CA96|nr:lysoplasmalogenase [Virgibacillus ndiopensis]